MEFEPPQPYVYGEQHEVQRNQIEIRVRDLKAGDIRYIDREEVIVHAETLQTSICADIETYSTQEVEELFNDGNLFEFCVIGCFSTEREDGKDGLGLAIDDSLMNIRNWGQTFNKLATMTEAEIKEDYDDAKRYVISDRAWNEDELEVMDRRLNQHNFTFAHVQDDKERLRSLFLTVAEREYGVSEDDVDF